MSTSAPPRRAAQAGAALAAAAGLAGAVAVLRARDPHVAGSYGFCPLLRFTGFDCPLCGGLRATNRLANGDVAAALDLNALFTLSVPLIAVAWLWWFGASIGLVRPMRWTAQRSNAVMVGSLAVLALFAVVRNLPGLEVLRSGA